MVSVKIGEFMENENLEHEKPVFDEEDGIFIFGDGTIPYCFYITCSAFSNIERNINDN